MTVAHVNFSDLRFPRFGYTGMVEPFVLLAGMVAGMLYGRVAATLPAREVWVRALRRAGMLYLVYLGLAFSIIGLTLAFRQIWPDFLPMRSDLIVQDPWLATLLVPVFVFQPGYADILPMYIAFIAFTPLAVLAEKHGRLALCAAGSFALWVLAQLRVGDRLFGAVTDHFGSTMPFFDILGWQAVYFAGLLIGIRRAARREPVVPCPPWLVGVSLAVVVACFFASQQGRGAQGWLENRSAFGPLKALNTAAFVVVLARLSSFPTPWLEQRWLAYIGSHALPVFVYSCFVGYLLTPFERASDPVRVAAVAVGVASLTIPARLHQRWREARAQRPRQAASATSAQPTKQAKQPAAPA